MATADENTSAATGGLNTTSVKSGQQWDVPKWQVLVTVGRDRRITKLRKKRWRWTLAGTS
ncbi:hypothetical protein ACLK19_08125 [Escherichia coli]